MYYHTIQQLKTDHKVLNSKIISNKYICKDEFEQLINNLYNIILENIQ